MLLKLSLSEEKMLMIWGVLECRVEVKWNLK
jgi:hypothetical protein